MKKLILITMLLFAGLFVRAQNEQGPKVTKDPTVYKGVTDQACAVEMSFGSYSAGIDGPSFDKLMKLIKDNNVAYTSKNIGREGETRICMPLNELKGSKRSRFIKQLKKIAKEGQLVSVSIR